jgi:hypothetical protein
MKYLWVILVLSGALIVGCSSRETPKEVTINFIGGVIDGDSTAIVKYLDLDAMIAKRIKEFPPTDTNQTPASLRQTLIKNLTGDGGTRTHWLNQRIVVNQETVKGDSAQVEMSMIDQTNGVTEYSMIYLYRKDGRWRVYFYL